ncbi:MAG TPA: undecaprenyldiphospho-muramoylpentapeptide beta-N-acetylglucosaminyltransferase, partial [Spirochaetia bacterium]|nr:undecaprenyldiphospho-muramoylpentapeptide beta-N-acetylglucosaminyltransferase [Spirochaetia bacterium]
RAPADGPLIVFAGGGTAGHVFPGLAVAEQLGRRIVWVGSSRGVERQLVRDAGVEFRGVPAGKLRRYLSLRNVTDVIATAAGVVASLRVLARERPAFLFSKGGFASVPPVIAARLLGIPSWTHESDFDAGLATRINARFCERVLVSFPETLGSLSPASRRKAVVTGNPVRGAIYRARAEQGRRFVGAPGGTPLVLVLGGSLGSTALNRLVRESLDRLGRFFIVHQTGEKEFDESARRPGYHPAAFFREELPDLLAAADLVVSRAGANTLAEIAALGRPSLLVPLPASSSRGDQLRNADVFRSRGASVVLPEETATPESFAREIDRLFDEPGLLSSMGKSAFGLAGGRPDKVVADLIRQRLGLKSGARAEGSG